VCATSTLSSATTKAPVQRHLLRRENGEEERMVLHYACIMEGGAGMPHQKEPTRCSHAGPAAACPRAQEFKGASCQAGEKQPAQRTSG
jgi:hypothetical protein